MFGDKKEETPEGGKSAGFTYRCTEKCTYLGKFYREDDLIVLAEKREKVPHFEFVEKEKK